MKESVAIAKEANSKKESSPTRSDNSILRLRNEPERQLGSLRNVIGNIRRNGGTPSVDSIATELSGMHTAQRAPMLLALQRTHGNQYVQRVVTGIQAKLKLGQPGDKYEQEADRVAEQVMRMPEPQVQRQPKKEEELLRTKPLAEQITPLIQRQVEEEEEEEEEILQTKENPGQTPEVTPDLESRIQSLKGSGQPLPEANRGFMERRFGIDFSGVRLHTDSDAAQMSRELNAEAFTYGRDIYFGAGRYSPGTSSGKRLLAHELTHVVQQGKDNSIKREKAKFYNSFCSVNRFTNEVDFTIQRACSTTNLDDCSDEDLLTAICIGEAGNIRARDGKKGVVNVVMNRVADSAFPNPIRDVVSQAGQFGGLNQGIRNLNNPSFSDCRGIAREVFNNPTIDPTVGALWFNQSCSKPCYQYCTTYLGDGSSPAHYFARRATTEERRNCRGTRTLPCCQYPRTRISYITFREEEVEPIIVQRKVDDYINEIKPLIQRSCLEHPYEEYYRTSQNYCKDTGRPLEPGNLTVKRLFKSGVIPAKLKIGQPGDKYEQEADRLAEQVMRMARPQAQQVTEEKGLPEVTPEVSARIQMIESGGQPLPEKTRSFFERRLGHDLSNVRTHTGSEAATLNKAFHAHAFTYGNHIWLGSSHHPSPSPLLTHELVHVMQQTRPPASQSHERFRSTTAEQIGTVRHSTEKNLVQRSGECSPVECLHNPLDTIQAPPTPLNLATDLAGHGVLQSSGNSMDFTNILYRHLTTGTRIGSEYFRFLNSEYPMVGFCILYERRIWPITFQQDLLNECYGYRLNRLTHRDTRGVAPTVRSNALAQLAIYDEADRSTPLTPATLSRKLRDTILTGPPLQGILLLMATDRFLSTLSLTAGAVSSTAVPPSTSGATASAGSIAWTATATSRQGPRPSGRGGTFVLYEVHIGGVRQEIVGDPNRFDDLIIHWTNHFNEIFQPLDARGSPNPLDPSLVKAMIFEESRFDPEQGFRSGSGRGMLGLMQVGPTERRVASQQRIVPSSQIGAGITGITPATFANASVQIATGIRILFEKYRRGVLDWETAVQDYNSRSGYRAAVMGTYRHTRP